MDTASSRHSSGATPPWLLPAVVVGMLAGALLGGFSPEAGSAVSVLGDLFLNALLMIVAPLVMLSMITGVTGMGDIRKLGSLGRHTILYYLFTTGLAVLWGILLVNVVRPGAGISHGESVPGAEYSLTGPRVTFSDGLQRMSYDNRYVVTLTDQGLTAPIEEVGSGWIQVGQWTDAEGNPAEPEASGKGIEIGLPIAEKIKGKPKTVRETMEQVLRGLLPRNLFAAMADNQVLPLIVFSLLLGGVLTTLGDLGRPAIALFDSLNAAIMGIVHLVMRAAPVGIFGLVAGRIAQAGGFEGFVPELMALARYFGTVVAGLGLHGIVVLPAILWAVGRRNPFRYAANMATALLNAFCTASSSATIPLTLQGVEERNEVSPRVAGFVVPLGATINMDGTALYEAVAAIFIAQAYGIDLSATAMVIVFLTATLASIGAAGIPEAGLVTMLIVLTAVGLPHEGVALLLTIDWLLDRFRTTVNVWGDAVGSAVVETLEMRSNSRLGGPAAAAGE